MPDIPARQPWLHDLVVSVGGNVTALSDASGDMHPDTAEGLYVDDRRVVSSLSVEVGGERPAAVSHRALGRRSAFFASARNLGSVTPDPVVEVHRSRDLVDAGMLERIRVTSRADTRVLSELWVCVASDAAPIGSIKSGVFDLGPITPKVNGASATFQGDWHDTTVRYRPEPYRLESSVGMLEASFPVDLAPGESLELTVHVDVKRRRTSSLDANSGQDGVDWSTVRVTGSDPRLEHTVSSALEDLRSLLLADPMAPQDVFAAAGTPWYLTLFGRDSIWAARLALPLGTDLARGTLRALGRRQGTGHDMRSGEAPGKIPHEVRRFPYVDPATGTTLPSVYFGTVDATALWVTLLHDAWCWGLAEHDVRDLLDVLDAALAWLLGDATPDGDSLLKYLDAGGRGLSNQGWKDSGDAIRYRDGSLADPPIALVEAQAYAVQALECGARLRDAFGRDGASQLRQRADDLRTQIRERFWVGRPGTPGVPYLGIAVDGSGRLVDGLASNMAHVLGTGCLRADEVALVAAAVTGPELLDRFGVRTLGTGNGGYNPIGYHTGSIWTHDTAIAALGLSQEGFATEAVRVASTLLASAEAFDYRWPELYCGEPTMGRPSPYPASCRPQAWSAASAVALLTVALGLRPDRESRTLHVHPTRPAAYGAMQVAGLRFADGRVDLDVAEDGTVTVVSASPDILVVVHESAPTR